MGSWQEARHTCVLVDCGATLTGLVATFDNSDCLQQALWFNPHVPVVQVGKELGTWITLTEDIRDPPRCWH